MEEYLIEVTFENFQELDNFSNKLIQKSIRINYSEDGKITQEVLIKITDGYGYIF